MDVYTRGNRNSVVQSTVAQKGQHFHLRNGRLEWKCRMEVYDRSLNKYGKQCRCRFGSRTCISAGDLADTFNGYTCLPQVPACRHGHMRCHLVCMHIVCHMLQCSPG